MTLSTVTISLEDIDMSKRDDWFDDYMIMKMSESNEDSDAHYGGGGSSNGGCLPVFIIIFVILVILQLFK
jgi:hypothetical protein